MSRGITIPLWLAVLALLLSLWAIVDRLLIPALRRFIRRRSSRALDEFDRRLDIKLQPFKLTKRQVLLDRLIYDPRLTEAAARVADEEGVSREAAMARVERYAQEIVPSFNAYFYFRLGYWLSRRIARLVYRVRLGYADMPALTAVPTDSAIVFIMNHRSNFDYILVSYLVAERTALSFAVGEWARIWPLESLIRAMGAYFVRRQARNDLYRQVLRRYVEMATEQGVTQAVFPEGALSRDGALRSPRLGLLDYMVSRFDPEADRDLVFVPVGINYDRVLEDRTLLGGLDVGPGRTPPLKAILNTLGFLMRNVGQALTGKWFRYGYACVNFGTPISMRQYLARRDLDLTAIDRAARFAQVQRLADELMGAVAAVMPALPVSLVASVVLADPDRILSELELKAGVQRLIARLEQAGSHVYIPRHDREYSIEVGIRMLTLRHLLQETDGLYSAVPEELPTLAYYANSIAEQLAGVGSAAR